MHTIHVQTETDTRTGWAFAVQVTAETKTHPFTVRLSWIDYDHWTHGRIAPEKVVHAAFRFLLDRQAPADIPPDFDCSTIRRTHPDFDKVLPTLFD